MCAHTSQSCNDDDPMLEDISMVDGRADVVAGCELNVEELTCV